MVIIKRLLTMKGTHKKIIYCSSLVQQSCINTGLSQDQPCCCLHQQLICYRLNVSDSLQPFSVSKIIFHKTFPSPFIFTLHHLLYCTFFLVCWFSFIVSHFCLPFSLLQAIKNTTFTSIHMSDLTKKLMQDSFFQGSDTEQV